MPATGWAAGIERINLILEVMKDKSMLSVADLPTASERANISILAHVDKREAELAPAIREYCIKLKRSLEALGGGSPKIPAVVSATVDLSRKKLTQKLDIAMNNQHEILRQSSNIIIIVGANELQSRTI